jgi:ELWxxDGT repeat protein
MKSLMLLCFAVISTTLYAQPWAHLVKDANPGSDGAGPNSFGKLSGSAFYSANDGTHGFELWISSGSAANTHMVKDINPASGGGGSNPQNFCALNGKMLFYAMQNGSLPYTLWATNGTGAGTIQLSTQAVEGNLMPMGNKAYFVVAIKEPIFGLNTKELWVTDGTPDGTKWVSYITAYAANQPAYMKVNDYTVMNNKLYFSVGPGCPNLYITDGSDTGTTCINMPPNIKKMAVYKNKLYFVAYDFKLYTTDGTPTGTVMISDFEPKNPSSARLFEAMADGLLIVTDKIWKSDGTKAGTKVVVPKYNYSNPENPILVGNKVYYTTHDFNINNLKIADLATGTTTIADSATNLMVGTKLILFKNKLLFEAQPIVGGAKGKSSLHVYDIAGGQMKAFSNITTNGPSLEAAIIGNEILLCANDSVNGKELWKINDVPTGIESQHNMADDIIMFPNPAHEVLTLRLPSGSTGEYKLTNVSGQLLLQGDAVQKTVINIASLPAGVYNVSVSIADGTAIAKRFVKQ